MKKIIVCLLAAFCSVLLPVLCVAAPQINGAENIQNGTIPESKLSATGTASSSTYLRGDWTWQALNGFTPQTAIVPDTLVTSDSANVVTVSPSYGTSTEPNGQVYRWQVYASDTGTPGSGDTLTVAGAGNASVDGNYTYGGTSNGEPWYTNGTYNINFGNFDGSYMYRLDTGSGPGGTGPHYVVPPPSTSPLGTWATSYAGYNFDSGPAPTVTAQSWQGPDGTSNTYWTSPVLVSGENGVPALTSSSLPFTVRCEALGDYSSGSSPGGGTAWVYSTPVDYSAVDGGTVTTFSAGNLSPLFTTSVSSASSAPDLTFTLSSASADSWFGNATLSSAAPSFNTSKIPSSLLPAYVVREVPSGTINGTNTTFTLANTPTTGSEMVFENGILQESGSGNDYTISGGTITFLSAPKTGWRILVTYTH